MVSTGEERQGAETAEATDGAAYAAVNCRPVEEKPRVEALEVTRMVDGGRPTRGERMVDMLPPQLGSCRVPVIDRLETRGSRRVKRHNQKPLQS
ncbi:hypothetical protein NDU88_001875 [Pleurodeles waltl]|uniref:Uncharacterized protein n=1 Tax=Pleurodeles waltl TaxID=8319 RepID=A0AAV7LCR5_PLEWA|nr:hypothetical protein NDU88_001875 [Pleurodeles waltl]